MNENNVAGFGEPLTEKNYGPAVRELHVDFLLEEEFSCSPAFLKWAIATVRPTDVHAESVEVKRSVCDAFGEADIQLIYTNGNGERVAILIEDKIGAVFQPLQAERYQERGEAGIAAGKWDIYRTCLVAPENYIGKGHGFDDSLSLEIIAGWFASKDDSRSVFKSRMIQDAVTKGNMTGVKVVDPVLTEFRRYYFALFGDYFSQRGIDARTTPPVDVWAGETWWRISSTLLPKGVYIHYKAPEGFVDLTFPNTHVNSLDALKPILEQDMFTAQTNKSCAIRLSVTKIKHFYSFEEEKTKVAEGLAAVDRLLSFYVREQRKISQAIGL